MPAVLIIIAWGGGRRETERNREKEAEREKVTRNRREGQKKEAAVMPLMEE